MGLQYRGSLSVFVCLKGESVMTLREFLQEQRKPEYAGINARSMLKDMVPLSPWSHACFHRAIATRERGLKTLLFSMARRGPCS
jgi:hypothetical protein